MNRILVALGAAVVSFGAAVGSIEAKTISFEINGQRYSYNIDNAQQVAEAQRRIEAAKAATARADAERATIPLVTIFGSPAQNEAAQAQARLKEVLSEQGATAVSAGPREPRTAKEKVEGPAPAKRQAAAAGPERAPAPVSSKPTASAAIKPPASRVPTVKSAFFDAESGIKTTFMTDGSIREELVERSTEPVAQQENTSAEETTGSTTAARGRPGPARN